MTDEQIQELLEHVSEIETSLSNIETRQIQDSTTFQNALNELITVSNVNFSILCLLALFLGSFIGVRLLGTVKKIWSGGKK